MQDPAQQCDAFVSHASEDKETFVRPLVEALGRLGVSLWYDEVSLKIGDSLSASIDRGIARSRNGLVVISPAFVKKRWPQAELHTLITRMVDGKLRLLPVWHGVDKEEVEDFSPLLAELVAVRTGGLTAQDVAIKLLAQLRPDLYEARGRSALEKLATGQAFEELEEELSALKEKVSDLLCPTCGAPLAWRIYSSDWSDPNQDDIETFECGRAVGGAQPQLCPHDPNFPEFTDYTIHCRDREDGSSFCHVRPMTPAAKQHYLTSAHGPSAKEAKNRVIESYNRGARKSKHVPMES